MCAYICIAHGLRNRNAVKAGGGVRGQGLHEGGQRGYLGDICNSVNNNNNKS